ncbi:MAG: flagellar hook-associated protein, partial [Burkholderiales bacterium]|nr:flagellar hook-associated protein [Burkholderiales bacterium]
MAISASGIGSGLDIESIISQLMAVEQRPLQQLAAKEASYQAKLSAYGSLKSAVSSFQSAMQALTSTSSFVTSKVSVSASDVLSARADASAVPGKYSIEVKSLAEAQK